MLEGIKLTKYFGGLAALRDVDFEVRRDEIVGLIGPNGAGKTTLFNVITGVYRPESGKVLFKGRDITGLSPHEICKLGIARTFQIVRPFLDMSALDNVVCGVLFGGKSSISVQEAKKEAKYYLEFVGLSEKRDMLARSLTLVERKMLEVATALATGPEVVLLDEVIAGLNPTETIEAMELIRRIRKELGITVFWIEHVMKALMNVAERIIVLHHGEKIAEGAPKEIASNRSVIEAYLGEKYVF